MLTRESSIKSNHDEEALEKIAESYSVDNSEIKNGGKIMPENAIIKEQENNQLEGSSMKRVITNFVTEGHVTSERTTKLSHDVDEHKTVKPHSIEDLQKKDTSEITLEETTDANQLTDAEIQKSETIVVSEDKAQQTLRTAISVRNEAVEESSQEEIHSEAELAAKYTKEMQKPQNEFNEEQEVLASKANEKLVTMDDGKFNQDEAKQIEDPPISNTAIECLPEEEVKPKFIPAIIQCATEQLKQQHKLDDNDPEVIENDKTCIPENELDKMPTIVEEPNQPETEANVSITKDKQADKQSEEHITSKSCTKLSYDMDEQKKEELHSIENLENKDTREIKLETTTDVKQLIDLVTQKSEIEGVPEDEALQSLPTIKSVGNEAVDECSPEEIPPETELSAMQNKEITLTELPHSNEVTTEINLINCAKEQEVSGSDAKEILVIKDDEKFIKEEAKWNEDPRKTQLPNTTTEIVQHDNISETIENDKNCILENELQKMSTILEELDQPGSEAKVGIVKEEQADNHLEGRVNQESSTKLSYDVDEHNKVDPHSENLENKDVNKITLEEHTDAKKLTIVGIEKSETKGVLQYEALQSLLIAVTVKNEAVDQSSQEEIQPETELAVASKEEITFTEQKHSDEVTTEISTNDTMEQEVLASDAKENPVIEEDDGKSDRKEAKWIENPIIAQLPNTATESLLEKDVKPKLSIPTNVQCDTIQLSQQQHEDIELEAFENDKSYIPENETDRMSTVVEEPNQPETKANVNIVKEQVDSQLQGHVTEESSTKLRYDADAQKTLELHSTENLKDASEITLAEATDAKQLTNMEIQKPKIEALQSLPTAVSVENEGVDESNQEEIQPEAELAGEMEINVEPRSESDEVPTEINLTHDTEEQEVPASHAKEKLVIKDYKKSNQEEEKWIEDPTKSQLPNSPIEMHIPGAVQCDTNQFSVQQKVNEDEYQAIENDKSCTSENEFDIKSTIVEETDQPESEANVSVVKELADNQSKEHVTSESSTKLNYEVDEQRTIESHSIENLENKDASEIKLEEATDAKQLTDMEIQKSESEGNPEVEALQSLPTVVSVRNEAHNESSQDEIQPNEVQTPQYEIDAKMEVPKVTAETNLAIDTMEQDVPKSDAKEKLVIKDDEKFDQEDAKWIEDPTEAKLPDTESESLVEEEVQPKLPTHVVVEHDTDQLSMQQKLDDAEFEANENDNSCIPENEFDIMSNVVEEPDQPQSMSNFNIVKEEQADNQSERHVTSESSTRLMYNVNEQKTEESHSVENLGNKDASEITLEGTIDAKQLTGVETQISETEESLSSNTYLLTLCIGQMELSAENEQKSECQHAAQNEEITFTEEPHSDEVIAKINLPNNTMNQEEVPTSIAKEKLVTEDDGKSDQEEKWVEDPTKALFPNPAIEKEVRFKFPYSAVVQHDTDNLSEQLKFDDESEVMENDNSCIPENELEIMSTVVEEPDLPETEGNISTLKEEQADNQSERHVTDSSTKLSYEDEQKTVQSRSIENSENRDATEITLEEATEAKQFTDVEIEKLETKFYLKTKGKIKRVPEEEAQQSLPTAVSIGHEAHNESSQDEIQLEAELESTTKENMEITLTKQTQTNEVTAETNITIDIEDQEVPKSEAKKKLVIEDDGKLDQEEEKLIEDPTIAQLPNTATEKEEVQPKLLIPAVVEHNTDQLSQKQKLDNDELEAIENDKSSKPENELDRMSTVVEEQDQTETEANVNIGKEEQADNQSQGHVTPKCSAKLSYDADEHNTIKPHSIENLENKDAHEITFEEATDAKQLTDLEIQKSEIEGVPEDEAIQSFPTAASVRNEAFDESSQEWIQPKAELVTTSRENKEITFTLLPHLEEATAEINLTKDTKERDEVPTSDAQEKLVFEDEGKSNQKEDNWIEEQTKAQLQNIATKKEEAQPNLPTPAVVQRDTDQLSQQQKLEDDESEMIENDKTCIAENELEKMLTIVEEPDKPETEAIVKIVKEEQANTQTEGHVTAESNTELSYDVNEKETVEPHSVENLENKDASEITLEEETDAKQLTDVEIQKSETKALTILLKPTYLVQEATDLSEGNEQKSESQLTAQKKEMSFTKKQHSEELTAEINPTNDTKEQEEVPASDAKVKLVIEGDGKSDHEEAKWIEDPTNAQLTNTATESLPKEEVQPKLPILAAVHHETHQLSQQQKLDNDESEAIDNDMSCRPENKHDRMSTVVEEPGQPETKANTSIVKEEHADNQSKEHVIAECGTKLSYDVDKEKTVEPHFIENLENKDASEITLEEATNAKQPTDVVMQKLEAKGVLEDEDLQSLPTTTSVGNDAVNESCQEEIQLEAELIMTYTKEEQIPQEEFDAEKDTPEEQEVPSSHTKEKVVIKGDENFDQMEAKGTEEATKMQLLNTEIEKEEVQPKLHNPAIVEDDTEQILQKQTLQDNESEAVDTADNDIPKIIIDKMSTVVEEPNKPETKPNVGIVKEEQADNQSEGSSMQSVTTNFAASEGHVTSKSSTKLSYDVDEQKMVKPQSIENLENKDASDITLEEVTNAKQLTDEIQKSEIEGLPHEEVQPKLATPVIAQGDTNQILPQHTLHKNEGEVVDNAKKCIPEKELDRMSIVVEEHDQPETKANVILVKEEQAYHQSEGSSKLSVITNHITAEEQVQSDSSTNFSYNVDEQKKEESHTVEHLENKDTSNITENKAKDAKQLLKVEGQKSETKGVPEDKVLQILPNKASVGNEAIDESSQEEERQLEVDFAVIFTKEVRKPQYEYDAEKDIPKEETCQLNAGNEQKSDSLPAVKNVENTFIKQPYSYGETAEIKSSNDTEEQENFPSSQVKEKLGIEDDGKFHGEEAKGIEEAAKMKLLISAIESLPKAEVQPKLPTPAIAQGDTDQILHQQTLQDDESEAIDNAKSCISENKLQRMCIVIEDPDQPEAMANISTVKEEQADHQSEASSMQSAITNYINAELVTSQSNTKLCYNVDEQKTVDAHTVSNLEIKDANNITAEEATDAIQLTEVDIQKSKIESVPEDKALQTLLSTASASIEEVDKSIRPTHTEAELAVTNTKEEQISENESEVIKEVSEYILKKALHLHKVTCQTSAGNEQKDELLPEQHSQESILTKHPNLEGETIEIKPTNETEELEKVPVSHMVERLEINDDGNSIQEEEKEMEKAVERQLLETVTESVPEDEAQTTIPESTIFKGEMIEGNVQEQTLMGEESAAIDNNSGTPENELEQMANVVETIDQHETMENVITKHINSEGTVTTKNSSKSTNDVEELEKALNSDSIDNSEINNGRKIIPEEESAMKETTGMKLQKPEIENVPEGKAISTSSSRPSLGVEIVEESIHEEIQKEAEPAVTNAKEVQRPDNDFVKNMEVLEAFDLHKASGNTCVENEKKAEVQSETKSQETLIIKNPNLEGLETAEASPSNDTNELEKETEIAKLRGVSESESADITEKTDTGNLENQEAETTQLSNTKDDEGGEEFEKISPSSSISVISRDSQDTDTKVSHKKSHGILSGVGSKVKHSISKVKKAITGKSSHQKTSSPKETK
uniref:Uncharacterized protein n=1 Tax=Cajanus cajan TaxID=3821 RepID=A0A151RSD1_CAJCA|nr:hypothetical protein KK1_033026 [Cajanus cajan]